jgi:uncharacterized Fe-S cluster-containing radical SAM superfamily protein
MREQVAAAVIRGNKSKTLRFVEPLYYAGLITHAFSLIKINGPCPMTLKTKKKPQEFKQEWL